MRQGYATEAAGSLLRYAKQDLNIDAVLGLFDPANEASKGVFRSLGFQDRDVHTLRVFGGIQGAVWALPDMSQDLSAYGI